MCQLSFVLRQGYSQYDPDGRLFVGAVPQLMGTKLSGIIAGASEGAARFAWMEALSLAGELEALLNRFDPTSEVSLLNAACGSGPRPVSPRLEELLAACEDYRSRTSGLFDITRDAASCLTVQDGTADLHGATLDFGGIGKGWFLRECRRILADRGIRDAFLCFGNSSILAMGSHPHGDCWKVSVIDPFTGDAVTERSLKDASLSVSGNRPGYEGHIIDPRTGAGLPGRRITVAMCPDPADAEALSTCAMLATGEELAAITPRFEGADVKQYNY